MFVVYAYWQTARKKCSVADIDLYYMSPAVHYSFGIKGLNAVHKISSVPKGLKTDERIACKLVKYFFSPRQFHKNIHAWERYVQEERGIQFWILLQQH